MALEHNVLLSNYASYRIGGPAKYFFRAESLSEVKKAAAEAKRLGAPFFILGGGTNLLFPDKGFDGLVIKPDIRTLKRKGDTIEAGAGVSMAELLQFAIKEGLSGLEWAGGLPGTFGGAIRGNAGAFGGETKDSISKIVSVDMETGKTITRSKAAAGFSYRNSIYKELGGREVIVSAVVKLTPGDKKEIKAKTEEKVQYRLMRHPMEYPNIGSIFKNVAVADIPKSRHKELVRDVKTDPIPVIPTARLITQAGLKGVSRGGAMISVKHPNFIVNVCEATAEDVNALMDLVKKEIKKKFSVKLIEEVERVSAKKKK